MAKRIDVQNTAAKGELSRFIHIVHFMEAEVAERLFQFGHILRLSRPQLHRTLIKLPLGDHQFRKGIRIGHDIK